MSYGIDAYMGRRRSRPAGVGCDSRCSSERAGSQDDPDPDAILQPDARGRFPQRTQTVLDHYQAIGATFCFPHQCVTDALIDNVQASIRDLDQYTRLIREHGMISGALDAHARGRDLRRPPGADVESYIQIFNAAGFLMQVEPDWVRSHQQAKKPVMTIKPLAAGRLLPLVGLSFVWSTLRPHDMVTIGTTTPAEAQEVINISLGLLYHRSPKTRAADHAQQRSSLLTY